ncbi:hypothetical protein [Cohnella sp. GCM10012308]
MDEALAGVGANLNGRGLSPTQKGPALAHVRIAGPYSTAVKPSITPA